MLIKLLRLFPPETAHAITIKLLRSNLKRKQPKIYKSLNQTIKGINFKNPIGLAAGFDKNAEVINQMFTYLEFEDRKDIQLFSFFQPDQCPRF